MCNMWVEVTWKLLEKALGRCQFGSISKDLRKKENISFQHIVVLPCVCSFGSATISLLQLSPIGYGPTHVSCE